MYNTFNKAKRTSALSISYPNAQELIRPKQERTVTAAHIRKPQVPSDKASDKKNLTRRPKQTAKRRDSILIPHIRQPLIELKLASARILKHRNIMNQVFPVMSTSKYLEADL